MKRKFSADHSQPEANINNFDGGRNDTNGGASLPYASLFPLPLLSATPENSVSVAPLNVNRHQPILPASKLRKVNPPVKIAPSPRASPSLKMVNTTTTAKRPLQALQPKPSNQSNSPSLSPPRPSSSTASAPQQLHLSNAPEAQAQLDLIASYLTPLSTTTNQQQPSQIAVAPPSLQTNLAQTLATLNPFSLSAVTALQPNLSTSTALLAQQLQVPNFAGMHHLNLSNFPLINPLDLNYINNIAKFPLPSKMMLNPDLAQAHNLLMQNPHLLQNSMLDLSKHATPIAPLGVPPGTVGGASGQASSSNTVHKIKPSLIPALRLAIGKWERNSTFLGEVCAKFYYSKKKIVWEIMTLGLMAKMEIDFTDIVGIEFLMPSEGPSTMTVQVKKPPRFFGEINPRPGKNIQWTEASDFTGGFASCNARHVLTFPKGSLHKHYEKLTSCDSKIKDLAKVGLSGAKSSNFNTLISNSASSTASPTGGLAFAPNTLGSTTTTTTTTTSPSLLYKTLPGMVYHPSSSTGAAGLPGLNLNLNLSMPSLHASQLNGSSSSPTISSLNNINLASHTPPGTPTRPIRAKPLSFSAPAGCFSPMSAQADPQVTAMLASLKSPNLGAAGLMGTHQQLQQLQQQQQQQQHQHQQQLQQQLLHHSSDLQLLRNSEADANADPSSSANGVDDDGGVDCTADPSSNDTTQAVGEAEDDAAASLSALSVEALASFPQLMALAADADTGDNHHTHTHNHNHNHNHNNVEPLKGRNVTAEAS